MDDVLPASSVAWTHSTKVECSRWPITLDRSPGAVCLMIAQYAVQIECSADQCKMSEGLRKIAQIHACATDLIQALRRDAFDLLSQCPADPRAALQMIQ